MEKCYDVTIIKKDGRIKIFNDVIEYYSCTEKMFYVRTKYDVAHYYSWENVEEIIVEPSVEDDQ